MGAGMGDKPHREGRLHPAWRRQSRLCLFCRSVRRTEIWLCHHDELREQRVFRGHCETDRWGHLIAVPRRQVARSPGVTFAALKETVDKIRAAALGDRDRTPNRAAATRR